MAVSKTGRSTWKIFWYHGSISKKTGEPPVIIDSTKTKINFDSIIIILIMDFLRRCSL
jgi:hypothetical protein